MQRGQVYRSEEVGIAYDEWYSELPKDARLLWYTLKNSRDMTACGLVKVAMGTLCFETAMTRDEVLAAIEAITQPFKSNGGDDYSRVVYWPRYDTFWIHNFYRKQRANTNPTNFDTSARKSLAQFPEVVQSCVLDTYPMLGNPIPIPLPSHPYPILDGSGIPSSISNKESVNSTISTDVEIVSDAPAKPKVNTGTTLPPDFVVTDDLLGWATAKSMDYDVYINPILLAEKFITYYREGKGKTKRQLDWPATWHQWVLSEIEKGGHKNGQQPTATGNSNGTAKARSTERAIREEMEYRARRQTHGDYHEGEVGSRPATT